MINKVNIVYCYMADFCALSHVYDSYLIKVQYIHAGDLYCSTFLTRHFDTKPKYMDAKMYKLIYNITIYYIMKCTISF